ncbi:MAG: hypothetical protein Q7R67_00375 [bacterium]|nr:hypothetical protein [bacterium]
MRREENTMKFLVLVPIIAFYLYQDFKLRRWRKREKEVVNLHCDMFDKYRELMEDPLMSYLKWKAWLPIFEAADERCEQLEPDMAARLGRVSNFVKRAINDDGYKQDTMAGR